MSTSKEKSVKMPHSTHTHTLVYTRNTDNEQTGGETSNGSGGVTLKENAKNSMDRQKNERAGNQRGN